MTRMKMNTKQTSVTHLLLLAIKMNANIFLCHATKTKQNNK